MQRIYDQHTFSPSVLIYNYLTYSGCIFVHALPQCECQCQYSSVLLGISPPKYINRAIHFLQYFHVAVGRACSQAGSSGAASSVPTKFLDTAAFFSADVVSAEGRENMTS